MNIFRSSAAFAFMAILISSCGCKNTGGRHVDGNAAQANEQYADSTGFYREVVLNDTPLTTYTRLRPENEPEWIGHLMSMDLSEFSSDINDSLNVFLKFDTKVNGYFVTCRFIPFGNDTETGRALWNFRNDSSDVVLFSDKISFYHTLRMSSAGIRWRNMDTYEFNYILPEDCEIFPVSERQLLGYYTPFQFLDVDFDGEKEVLLNDMAMYREGNGYYAYKIKGNRCVPFDIFPYDKICNSTEFDFRKRMLSSYTHYHSDLAVYIYFSLPTEKEWRITDLPELCSSSYDDSIKDDILNSPILAIDSLKEYFYDTLYIYRRYGHSLKLTDKISQESSGY